MYTSEKHMHGRIVELSRDGKQWNKAEWNEVYAF